MKLMSRLLALFIVVPVAELFLLIRMGQWLGLLPTVALVMLTGVAGAALARREGVRTLTGIQSDLRGGRLPAGRLLDGVLILLAGGLLLTPGVLTDVVGLGLLLAPVRGLVKREVVRRVGEAAVRGRSNLTVYYDEPPPPGRAL